MCGVPLPGLGCLGGCRQPASLFRAVPLRREPEWELSWLASCSLLWERHPRLLATISPTACPALTFGHNCTQTCACFNGASCDPVHGRCRCAPGWMGPTCQQGKPHLAVREGACWILRGVWRLSLERQGGGATLGGTWLPTEPVSTHPKAASRGVPEKVADPKACVVKALGVGLARGPRWLHLRWLHSPPTPACPAGLYGEKCAHACLCQHGGSCDPASGHCTCSEGWTGPACESGE